MSDTSGCSRVGGCLKINLNDTTARCVCDAPSSVGGYDSKEIAALRARLATVEAERDVLQSRIDNAILVGTFATMASIDSSPVAICADATFQLAELRIRLAAVERERDEALEKQKIDEQQCDDMTEAAANMASRLASVEAERDAAQCNYQFMVSRAADEKLDGYRALGARAAEAENERDDIKAKADRMQAALQRIASCESKFPGDVVDIARAALVAAPVNER